MLEAVRRTCDWQSTVAHVRSAADKMAVAAARVGRLSNAEAGIFEFPLRNRKLSEMQ